jgi:hypothetical protein
VKYLFFARHHFANLLSQEKDLSYPDKDKVFELEATIQFIEDEYGSALYKLNSMGESRITFWLLWTLFPAQTVVYTTDLLNHPRAARTLTTSYNRHEDGSWSFCVSCENMASNGTSVGYAEQITAVISEFQDIVDIQSLKIFPIDCHPEAQGIKQRLIARGRKGFSLDGRHVQEYKGLATLDYDPDAKTFPKFFVSCFKSAIDWWFNDFV